MSSSLFAAHWHPNKPEAQDNILDLTRDDDKLGLPKRRRVEVGIIA
jgi:hypothetical protein